jgi:hypothetical protein
MAPNEFFLGLAMVSLASVAPASQPHSAPVASSPPATAPAGTPQTRYCLRVDPVTGSNVETIQCWTREEWTEQGVDVDKEWAKNGVRAIA